MDLFRPYWNFINLATKLTINVRALNHWPQCLLNWAYQGCVVLWIDGLDILHDKFLVQHPFVERHGESRVDKLAVVKRHGNKSADKLEVMQMVRVDKRGWINLETIVVLVGIFKQAIHRIKHLMGQKEKPFPETKF